MFARVVQNAAELERCLGIRRTVFIDEQHVDEALELDGLEDECTHFVAWHEPPYEPERAVGTARLLLDADGVAKAQRVAVLAEARREGVGALLMRALEDEARQRSAQAVVLGAQLTAVSFYETLGYAVYGDVFDDAGIPHRMMRRTL